MIRSSILINCRQQHAALFCLSGEGPLVSACYNRDGGLITKTDMVLPLPAICPENGRPGSSWTIFQYFSLKTFIRKVLPLEALLLAQIESSLRCSYLHMLQKIQSAPKKAENAIIIRAGFIIPFGSTFLTYRGKSGDHLSGKSGLDLSCERLAFPFGLQAIP